MGSRLVTFRIPEDLYEEFQQKCSDEQVTVSERLRKFIDDSVYPPGKPETMRLSRAELEQTTADGGGQVEKLADGRLSYLEQKLAQLDQVVTWLLGRLNKIEQRHEIGSANDLRTVSEPDLGTVDD